MKCHSKYNLIAKGFTLIEVMAAVIILALITSGSLVAMNRYMKVAIDQGIKMEAFNLARENMENILSVSLLTDDIQQGQSETNPDIRWQNSVESFYEPLTSRMWIRAICGVSYIDSEGEDQEIELTHWVTDISKKQVLAIIDQKKREKEYEEEIAEDGEDFEPEDVDEPDEDMDKDKEKEEEPEGEDDFIICGFTMDQLNAMSDSQMWAVLMKFLNGQCD